MIRPALALTIALMPALASAPAMAQSRSFVTDDVDKFMLAFFDRIQPQSIADNLEYCGLVGFNAEGALEATPPQTGTEDSCDPGQAPAEWDVIATYHTHGAFLDDADSEVPSVDDLVGDIEQEVDGYIATPGGRVWLNVASEKLTFQLCGRNCVASDPRARQCTSFTPKPEYTLEELRKREAQELAGC